MLFSKALEDNLDNITSQYDLAAYCYYYLNSTISNQNIFLGDYIKTNPNAESHNPNQEMLSQFMMQIKHLLELTPMQSFSSKSCLCEILNLVLTTENVLKDFGESHMNQATIPFYILNGIDLYFKDRTYQTYKTAPLNNFCKEFCLIYVNHEPSWMDCIIIEKDYPDIIHPNEIRYYFEHIMILETKELPNGYGIPKLQTLHKESEYLNKIIKTNKMKIALIPATKDTWFRFAVKKGSSFEIEYYEDQLENIKERIITLLKQAIERKVNIIVFPEYICKEEIQTEIQNTLSQMNEDKPNLLKELLLVVAGSGWTNDSNNVSCLYSYDGTLLGRVYKYSAYDNEVNGSTYTERLQNPGKEITLIKIPGAGIVQTEICRNISENEFSLKLAKIFGTTFLLIAAWSTSVNIGFKKQIDCIIASNHKTCAAMSNCCAAFTDTDKKSFRNTIGIVAVPQKNGSFIEGNYEYILRDAQLCSCCKFGCIYDICYDFNGSDQNDVKITKDYINALK